jgi:uncharacterized protein YbjT (DUF2867 family)
MSIHVRQDAIMIKQSPFVAVIGGTGNIGRQLVDRLLEHGMGVRAIGRRTDQLALLSSRGADVCAGNVQDSSFLTQALTNARAVFAMLPENPSAPDFHADKRRSAESIAHSIRASRVARVVAVSAIGAIPPNGIGPAKVNREFEEMLTAIPDTSTEILRAAFLMENHLASINLIKRAGINGSPARAHIAFHTVSTRDIAHAAAEALISTPFTTHTVRNLLGPRDYAYDEISAILGAAIGKPELPYIEFPYAKFHKAVTASGVSPEFADALVELYMALNDQTLQSLVERNPSNTTSTTLEQFAREVFAPAYHAS